MIKVEDKDILKLKPYYTKLGSQILIILSAKCLTFFSVTSSDKKAKATDHKPKRWMMLTALTPKLSVGIKGLY